MASTYGFRIFVVRAFVNLKKGREPEDVSVGSAAQRRVVELLEEAAVAGTHFVLPPLVEGDEPARPVATITVSNPVTIRKDLRHLEVASGEQGSHPAATRQGEDPLDLGDWSPEAAHFVTFLFPQDQNADRFLVVVQTIRHRDPLGRLLSRMTALDLKAKMAAVTAETLERDQSRAAGHKLGDRAAHERLLFDARQAADNSYIDQILGAAKSASAVFTASVPSDRGRHGELVQRRLTIQLLDEKGRDVARTAGRRWYRRQREGEETSRSAGVSELGGLLEAEALLEEGEAHQYTSASITIRSETAESTTIAVDTMRDVFTYPVSDGRPSVSFHYDKVGPRVEIVAAEEEIEVMSIDTAEVVELCPDDLTSGR